jgi:hypothetical protein
MRIAASSLSSVILKDKHLLVGIKSCNRGNYGCARVVCAAANFSRPHTTTSTTFAAGPCETLIFRPRLASATSFNSVSRRFASFRQQKSWSPYDVLKVSRVANDKEIKAAYYSEAKKCHPDFNPNNPAATAQFQRLAEGNSSIIS